MANSMDIIKVNFGAFFTKEEGQIISNPFSDPKVVEKLKSKIKTCSIREFIYPERYPDNEPLNLSETEKKVQEALRKIYEMNEKDPPLYKKFPTFRQDTNPLIVDITTLGNTGNGSAAYDQKDNRITFKEVDRPDFLILTLVHELKHAEQCDEESYLMTESAYSAAMSMAWGIDDPMENAYAWHQREFLSEAQAYETCARAYYEMFGCPDNADDSVKIYAEIAEKYADSSGQEVDAKIKEEAICRFLDILYGSPYKDSYDMIAPIGEKDTGLDHIPEVFHLPETLMKKLKEAPKLAGSLSGKLSQAKRNNHIDDYVQLLQEVIKQKEDMPVDLGYVLENASSKQLNEVLSLKKEDGKYLFETEKIRDKFSDIHINLSPETLKYLIGAVRNKEKIITPRNIGLMLGGKVAYSPDSFANILSSIVDDKGRLPITEKDLIKEVFGGRLLNELLQQLNPGKEEDVATIVQMLPKILKLKGSDDKPLVSEKQLAERLSGWLELDYFVHENVEVVFNSIKDKKGNLALSRKAFDTKEGKNILLESLIQANPASGEQLPILMSLKDTDGKPIISKENIDICPQNNPLTPVDKAYAKSQDIPTLREFISTQQGTKSANLP
ncbi:MAG: hypothetical protein J6P93_00685, partial [Alphaproteobacteria bacterium]|nr:hypothetical protein [Alphaproteobacteria bacterium]